MNGRQRNIYSNHKQKRIKMVRERRGKMGRRRMRMRMRKKKLILHGGNDGHEGPLLDIDSKQRLKRKGND